MKRLTIHVSIIIVFLLIASQSKAQSDQIYTHPILNIQFVAPSGWEQLPRPEDRLIYEIVDPDRTVHVVLWYTETMQDAPGYMKKMAGMKDLLYDGEPEELRVDGREAWRLDTSGPNEQRPIRLLLAVIHHEKPISHADHNALFVIQIWCPEEFYAQKKQQMEKILKSIRFTEMQSTLASNKKYGVSFAADNEDTHISELISGNTAFGFKLFKELIHQDRESNVFISPLSVSTALAMTYNGAAGRTQKAMAETLELQGMSLARLNKANTMLADSLIDPESGVELNLANSLWADKNVRFKTGFLDNTQEFYEAEIRNLDLSQPRSIEVINDWINTKTEGKINKVVDFSDLDAILFLINAVYFKGAWTVGFSQEYTQEREFALIDGSTKKVPMMMSQSDRYSHFRGDGFQAVELPYGNERVSLALFLPDRDSSLQEFLNKLNRENWESWMAGFRKDLVGVVLPRLRLEYEIELSAVLKALGMGIAFAGGADFSNMCSGDAYIDEVIHKTFVDVNEEGTEASAVTVVKMKRGGQTVLVFDRPFFCAIKDNVTGAILFMGFIIQP